MSDIRYPTRQEVEIKVDSELHLLCMMAATISTQGIEPRLAVNTAKEIMDLAVAAQEERIKNDMDNEYHRRRGY